MLGNTTPKERLGYVGIATLMVGFLCYIGAQHAGKSSAPLVIQEQSPHRTPKPEGPSSPTPPESKVVVHIVGAVKNPGVYTLSSDKHLIDAVKAAGGFSRADEQKSNLASRLSDGTRYSIPFAETPGNHLFAESSQEEPAAPEPNLDRPSKIANSRGKKSPSEPVDLNTASSDELMAIPGIGPSTADRILSYRSDHGSFKSIDELTAVGGIGPKKLEKMRPWLRL